jgi:hypothetical protein
VRDDDGEYPLSAGDRRKIVAIMAQLDREAGYAVQRNDAHASGTLGRRLIIASIGAAVTIVLVVGLARELHREQRTARAVVPNPPPADQTSNRPSESLSSTATGQPQNPSASPDPAGHAVRDDGNPAPSLSTPRAEPLLAAQERFPARALPESASAGQPTPEPTAPPGATHRELSPATDWILWTQEEGPEAQTPDRRIKAVFSAQSGCDKALRDEMRRAMNDFIVDHGTGYGVGESQSGSGWGGFHDENGATHVDIGVTYECRPGIVDSGGPAGR